MSRPASPAGSESCGTSSSWTPSQEQSQQIAVYLQVTSRSHFGPGQHLIAAKGSFLPSILPTHAEFAEKEAVRQRLEALAHTILPGARLLPFGSTANGLALRNSDMDLNMVLPLGYDGTKSASELVMQFGSLIERGPWSLSLPSEALKRI
jgi:hypothetical protein